MGVYEDMLTKLGLMHLKNDPDKLQEAILSELGLSELKGNHAELMRQSGQLLKEKEKALNETKSELGRLIQTYSLKRNN